MNKLLPSELARHMADEAITAHTQALRAAKHLPLRQGHTWECARCGEQAYMDKGLVLCGPMSQHACGEQQP